MTPDEVQETIDRLEVLAEFHIGTPTGGIALAALRAINHLQQSPNPAYLTQTVYREGFQQGRINAINEAQDAVLRCLAWEDELLDDDGNPRLYLWQDHALAALRALRDKP